ncbi:MAG: DUF4190 domain-containing protein [Acidimicrobiales bacterium]
MSSGLPPTESGNEPAPPAGPGRGWYPDPSQTATQRYWDGAAWTDQTAPIAPERQPASGTNGLAIASLVLGIVWVYWIGSILAVIFGHVAKRQLKQPGNSQGGSGLATAGLVLGYVGIATLAVVIIAAAAS